MGRRSGETAFPEGDLDKGRFPRAVLSEQAHDVARFDREVHVLEDERALFVAKGDLIEF
jgi:hypothetical protein